MPVVDQARDPVRGQVRHGGVPGVLGQRAHDPGGAGDPPGLRAARAPAVECGRIEQFVQSAGQPDQRGHCGRQLGEELGAAVRPQFSGTPAGGLLQQAHGALVGGRGEFGAELRPRLVGGRVLREQGDRGIGAGGVDLGPGREDLRAALGVVHHASARRHERVR
ncbi:hypothetical protein PYK79_26710 [Streptomyces sp. ID05-04B]|uniref:hypothetical protein n=1 Tax=Streptomyces sp. ID05-04B TaxID=3028661 RepID=UPI0029C59F30|nr:hypothetical protein [Streptomyces sp. ID05-04B]MDX5566189.1 hypothetical protein [Streptomyces sp. ID05-04B]